MIILRRLFSESNKGKLRNTRVGIGWLNETMGKNEAEGTYKDINDQIEEDYKEGKTKEEIIENAEKAGKRSVKKREVPRLIKAGVSVAVPAGVTTYALSKNSKLRNRILGAQGIDLNHQKVSKVLRGLDKHKGKLTAGAAIGSAAIELSKKKNLPVTKKKVNSAKNSGRRTAQERTKDLE